MSTAAGLPRWPHSSQLTRLLRAERPQQVQAPRAVVETVTAEQSTVRRRLRQGQRVVIDLDQTACQRSRSRGVGARYIRSRT